MADSAICDRLHYLLVIENPMAKILLLLSRTQRLDSAMNQNESVSIMVWLTKPYSVLGVE